MTRVTPPSAEQLSRFLAVYAAHDQSLVIELRALEVPQRWGGPKTFSGFFDLALTDRFLTAVWSLLSLPPDEQPEGIYVTMNPVNPALLARANNRLRPEGKKKISATDKDTDRRRWLVVDVDPVRPANVSATDDEKAAARKVLDGIREDLNARGWPGPMVVDSGNGFHLWYPIGLPADDGGLVERTLKALAARHDTTAAKVDTSLFNASRIIKLPGTWARKGDSIPNRPHRMARVLEVPG